jgi:hypothetical protein
LLASLRLVGVLTGCSGFWLISGLRLSTTGLAFIAFILAIALTIILTLAKLFDEAKSVV